MQDNLAVYIAQGPSITVRKIFWVSVTIISCQQTREGLLTMNESAEVNQPGVMQSNHVEFHSISYGIPVERATYSRC